MRKCLTGTIRVYDLQWVKLKTLTASKTRHQSIGHHKIRHATSFNMGLAKIIIAGIAGTTAMTLFSYYSSRKRRQNFREPELLGELIVKIIPSTGKQGSLACGWMVHYLVGMIFSGVYTRIPRKYLRGPVLLKFALTGSLTGIIGIAGWQTVLQLHPDPPRLNYRRFYGQLIPAHAVFGITALLILYGDQKFVTKSTNEKKF